MDEQLSKVFEWIKQELKQVHYRWKLYRQIFATNSHRIELINRTSSNAFVVFQWLLIDYMVMSLSKLTDQKKIGNNNNLSFHYLIKKLRESGAEELIIELNDLLNELTKACDNFRSIRNKRIAHNDLVVAIKDDSSLLPGVSRADIERALELARDIMNKVQLYFNKGQTFYQEIILSQTNDGRSVLIWLQKGLAYKQLEDEGIIERGKWREFGEIDS